MEFNLADLFENAVDHFPDREYLVAEGKRRTYAEMEERANRLAHHLAAHGVGPGDHVGIYAYNSVEWVETLWAVFKIRAVWVNINYRYVEDELAYLFDNADLKALVYQREFAPRVRGVLDRLPLLTHSVVIDDGSGADLAGLASVDYEAALASRVARARLRAPLRRRPLHPLHRRHDRHAQGCRLAPRGRLLRARRRHRRRHRRQGRQARRTWSSSALAGNPVTSMPIAPLMHGATQWGVMGGSFIGNKIVLVAKFEPGRRSGSSSPPRSINMMMITGDAMARPLARGARRPALRRPRPVVVVSR